MNTQITNQNNSVQVLLGDELEGYSARIVWTLDPFPGITDLTISRGSGNSMATRDRQIIIIEYKPYKWYIRITDPDLIGRLIGCPQYSEWFPEVLRHISVSDVLKMIHFTMKNTESKSFQQGQKAKAASIRKELGLL